MSSQNFEATRVQQCTDVQFQAVVTGKPIPEVSWTKKGNNLPNSDKYQHTYDPKSGHITLLIVDIGPGDEGQYRQDSPKIKLNKSVLSIATFDYVSTQPVLKVDGTIQTRKIKYKILFDIFNRKLDYSIHSNSHQRLYDGQNPNK